MDFYNRDLFLLENIIDYLQRSYPSIYSDDAIINKYTEFKDLNIKKKASSIYPNITFSTDDINKLEELYIYFYGSSNGGPSSSSLASNYLTTVNIIKELINKSDYSIQNVVSNINSLLKYNDKNDKILDDYLNTILIPSLLSLNTTEQDDNIIKYDINKQIDIVPLQQPINDDDIQQYINKFKEIELEKKKIHDIKLNELKQKQQELNFKKEELFNKENDIRLKKTEEKKLKEELKQKQLKNSAFQKNIDIIRDPIYLGIADTYNIIDNNTIDKNSIFKILSVSINTNTDIINQILLFIDLQNKFAKLNSINDNDLNYILINNEYNTLLNKFKSQHYILLSKYSNKVNKQLSIDEKFNNIEKIIRNNYSYNNIINRLDDIKNDDNSKLNISIEKIETLLTEYYKINVDIKNINFLITEKKHNLKELNVDLKEIKNRSSSINYSFGYPSNDKSTMLKNEISELKTENKKLYYDNDKLKSKRTILLNNIKSNTKNLIKLIIKILKEDNNKYLVSQNDIKTLKDAKEQSIININKKNKDISTKEGGTNTIDGTVNSTNDTSVSSSVVSSDNGSSPGSDEIDNIEITYTNDILDIARKVLEEMEKNNTDDKKDSIDISIVTTKLNDNKDIQEDIKDQIILYYKLKNLKDKIDKDDNDDKEEIKVEFDNLYNLFIVNNNIISSKKGGSDEFIEIDEIYKLYYNNIKNDYINELYDIFDIENSIYILLLFINCIDNYNNYNNIDLIFTNLFNDLRDQIINFYNTDILLVYFYNYDEIIYYNFINYIYNNLLIIKSKSNNNINIKIKNNIQLIETVENYKNIFTKLNILLKNQVLIEKFIIFLKKHLKLPNNLINKKTKDTEYLLLFIYKYSKLNENIILEGFDAFLTYMFLNSLNKISDNIIINNKNYNISKLPTLNLYNFCNLTKIKTVNFKMTNKQANTCSKLLNDMKLLITIIYKKYKYLETISRNFNPLYYFYINDNIIDFINIFNDYNYDLFNNYNKIPIIDLYSLNTATTINNNEKDDILYLASYNFKDYNEIPDIIYIKLIKQLFNNNNINTDEFLYDMIYKMNNKINKINLEEILIKELPNENINDLKKFIYPKYKNTNYNIINILKNNYYKQNNNYNVYIPYLLYYYKDDINNKFQYEIQDLLCDNIISMINNYSNQYKTVGGDSSSSASSSSILPNNISKYVKNGEDIINNIYTNMKQKFVKPEGKYEKTIFDDMMEKYERDYNNTEIPRDLTNNKFYNDVKLNNLDIEEELAITTNDKIIFIVLIYIIRLITLYICYYYIDRNTITDINKSLYYYLIVYYAIFLLLIFIINFDTFKLRIIFNYMNLHVNTPILLTHLILIGFFIYLIYLLIKNILGLEKAPTQLGEHEKMKLKYKLDLLTLIIYIFCCISIILF